MIKPVQNRRRCSLVFTLKLHHIPNEGQHPRSTDGEERVPHWNWQHSRASEGAVRLTAYLSLFKFFPIISLLGLILQGRIQQSSYALMKILEARL